MTLCVISFLVYIMVVVDMECMCVLRFEPICTILTFYDVQDTRRTASVIAYKLSARAEVDLKHIETRGLTILPENRSNNLRIFDKYINTAKKYCNM